MTQDVYGYSLGFALRTLILHLQIARDDVLQWGIGNGVQFTTRLAMI